MSSFFLIKSIEEFVSWQPNSLDNKVDSKQVLLTGPLSGEVLLSEG